VVVAAEAYQVDGETANTVMSLRSRRMSMRSHASNRNRTHSPALPDSDAAHPRWGRGCEWHRHGQTLGDIGGRGPRGVEAHTAARSRSPRGGVPALRCSEKSKPYGWFWHGEAPPFGAPLLGLHSALLHDLVERHLVAVLPRSLLKGLKPSFEQARRALATSAESRLAAWSRSVRMVPAGYPRRPPEVRGPVLEVVYEALYRGRRFEADYRKSAKPGGELRTYEVSPLGLVLRSGILTLVATFWEYSEVNHLSLHKIRAARPLETRAQEPRGFNLDEHLRAGKLGFLLGPPLHLRARVRDFIAERLEDVALGDDQRLGPARGGWCALDVRVHDSMELRGWIRSLGPLIEVLSPKALRAALREDVAALQSMYSR
jgi:predicted DNA-binding transcriptional regulator YafY